MKKLLLAFVLAVLSVGVARAQTPAPEPTSTFVLTGNYAAFTGTTATTGAAIMTAGIQIAPRVSVGYEHISVPAANARWELGVAAYTLPLNALLGKTLSSKLTIDTSAIDVTFTAGAGKILQPTVNRIAETAGVHFSYPLSDHVSIQIVGVDVLHGGVQTGLLTTSTTQAVSTGLNFYF